MPMTAEKKAFVEKLGLPPDVISSIEDAMAKARKAADDNGVSVKEVLDAIADAQEETKEEPRNDLTEVMAALNSISETMKGIAAHQAEQDESIKALKASDEERISRIVPQRGYVASQAGDNILDGRKAMAREAKDALTGDSMPDVPAHLREQFGMLFQQSA